MVRKKKSVAGKKKDITLHDVIAHLGTVKQELLSKLDEHTKKIDENTKMIAQNSTDIRNLDRKLTTRIDTLEENMNKSADALREDLIATIQDTVKIRKHVGMPVSEEF